MSENVNGTQTESAEKTFSQDQLDAIVGERLARERAKYADYEELKAKAAKFDEAEEANKSELEKAVEERNKYKEQLAKLESEKAHAAAVAKAAAEHGVDAELLRRMNGDVEANAAYLKSLNDQKPKFDDVPDGGETNPPAGKKSTASLFADAINNKN